MNTELTQAQLKALLYYNPETGLFTWKESRGNHVHAGDPAGFVNVNRKKGTYVKIKINSISYRAHRLAFLYVKGSIPSQIDHINTDGTDNRWDNLRETNNTSNSRNKGRRRDNKSGITGVSWGRGSWRAAISVNGKRIFVYHGKSKHDAIVSRYNAEIKYGWHKDNSATSAKRYVESLREKSC